MKKYILVLVLILNLISTSVWAAESFVVRKITFEGLQGVSAKTVESYLPIKPGETLRPDKTGAVIDALYKTGFFEHISLARDGDTLVIQVVERPVIGQLKISGNSAIPTDKLTGVMKSLDIAEGHVYNSVMLERIKQSLLNQYYMLGRYNARVDVYVTPMDRARVKVNIVISEGLIAKVRRINIIGNHAFSNRTLNKQLDLTTPSVVSFFTQSDRFSQEKLDSSLESLRNYYMDRGYLKFAVKSSQAGITPDRKSMFLTIVIDEGALYTIKGVEISGQTVLPRDVLLNKINIQPGSVFSRKKVVNAEKIISDALGNEGYLFAVVTVHPTVDETTKQVFLSFEVKPGKRAYVRHVYFTDNSKTNDVVLRREIQQMEAAPVSTSRLEDSTHRLKLLPFIREVNMGVEPVEGTDDTVDVNYKVTEDNAASMQFSVGYSQLDHLILSAGFNQKNFLGTGNTLGVNLSRSRFQQFYGINYTNPYFTEDGISRSLSLSVSKFNPAAANVTRSYTDNQYSLTDVYGIPIGQEKNVFNRLQLGYGYEGTFVRLSNTVSTQVQSFVNNHGEHFQQLILISGFSRDSRDKDIFPTSGMIHVLGANVYLPLNGASLKYYTASYDAKWYHPLVYDFILTARGNVAYGNAFNGATNFPFFKNFYAGGIGSVRGYEGNTLGPTDSNGNSTGGNALVDGGVGLVIPNHISDNLRTTVFVDAGNVYNTFNNRQFGQTPNGPSGSGPIRYSAGIEADWLSPMGLVDVSVAQPLNLHSGDTGERVQFSLGANFG